MSESNENNFTKKWKSVKILDTYESANDLKEKLLAEDSSSKLEVKIRRCGDGGSKFKVKSWYPPENKTNKAKKLKAKGKRNER
jgi:hypothetical protein|tara:strand:- start:105 stop:353 length:249 start_codon:yes stop_codon:yes gene_type:complete